MKPEVMFFVADVEKSSRWYQELLGAKSGHGGTEYEMIVDAEGERVAKGDLLFELYSPELVNAQKEYLQAVRRGDERSR